jgi:putative transposase
VSTGAIWSGRRWPATQVWEMDHKNLPIMVLLPRGRSCRPWLTSIVDTGTRALIGWAIALTPSSATVLTALRMALVHERDRGPFGGVPALVRYDGGLEFRRPRRAERAVRAGRGR